MRHSDQAVHLTGDLAEVSEFCPKPEEGALLAGLVDLTAWDPLPTAELLETAATRLAGFLGDTCVISLLSDDRQWLRPVGIADRDPDAARALAPLVDSRLEAGRGFTRQVVATMRPIRLTELSPEVLMAGRPQFGEYVRRFGVRSALIVPMRTAGRMLGHIVHLRRPPAAPYSTGDKRLLQAVADVLGMAIARGAAPPFDDVNRQPVDLSRRECEILAGLSLGHTNREIAEQLHLSVRTVEWYRARLQRKLGVSGRAALVRAARAHCLGTAGQ
jgi:DNA-binding CsgD family transcriptional regulator